MVKLCADIGERMQSIMYCELEEHISDERNFGNRV